MTTIHTTLADCLAANQDREWIFVKPSGNWGDALIHAGAESLARRLGMRWIAHDWRSFDPVAVPAGTGIYLHGGGGFNTWGSQRHFLNLRHALAVKDALVIQGPETCDAGNSEVATMLVEAVESSVAERLHVFARERVSAEFLDQVLPRHVAVHLDHDTALHLDAEEVLSLGGMTHCPAGRYTLLVSREDDEAPGEGLAAPSRVVRMDPAYYATSFPHWLRIHAHARHIVANRLHSAIAGSLLGKPVTLLPASYHKNRSVWEFSLRERAVEWGRESGVRGVQTATRSLLPGPLARSWKVQRSLMWLRGVPAS